MGDHRCFSNSVVDGDYFLDMPLTTQALYFHLGMKADDDGFVDSPKKIVRAVGCAEDDLKLLISKGFVIGFNSGVIVITHWHIHNSIRKDRYKPTLFQKEKQQLLLSEIKTYTLADNQLTTICQPSDNQMSAQGKVSKDKVSKDKVSKANKLTLMSASADARAHFDYQSVVDSFNSVCVSLPKVKKLTDKRRKAIRKANLLLDDLSFESYFALAEQSDFLTGRSGNDWRANFDWVLEEKHLVKIIEGCYISESDKAPNNTTNKREGSEVDWVEYED